MDLKIGRVTHYYDKIAVAVVEIINQPLRVGDRVKFSGHDKEFNQTIASIQIEHAEVHQLPAGETGAVAVDHPVKEGDVLYLLTHEV